MPLPTNGLPVPIADMKDIYGLAEVESETPTYQPGGASGKDAQSGKAASTSGFSLAKLLRKKGASAPSTTPAAHDSQETLAATTVEPDDKAETGAKE